MARDIVTWPNSVLTTSTRKIVEFGPALDELLAEMNEAVRKAEGIGLAANQIGVPQRVALVAREEAFFEIINPTILSQSEPVVLEEGCLSVPGEFEQTPRFHRVRVRYQDRTGATHEVDAEGRLAHIFQHEIGHLDGHVFVELISSLKRGLIRDKMKKLKRTPKDTKDPKE